MKISRFNLKILESELLTLEHSFPDLRKAIADWSSSQDRRDNGSVDQEWVAIQRSRLERELTAFRERLAVIYDFMGDRGLTEFIPTRIRNEREASKPRLSQVGDESDSSDSSLNILDYWY